MPRLRADAGLAQAANVLRETGHRLLRAPELVGTLAGSRRPELLRLRVLILRDEEGKPVVATLDVPAPSTALDSPCARGSWRADFGTGGAFFRRFSAHRRTTGAGAPVTVFVVRDVLGKAGCSLGPLVDYVTVDMTALRGRTRRVLVHELGHACGLPHSRAAENLMLPKRMGERLLPWQVAVLRSSRHVSYR